MDKDVELRTKVALLEKDVVQFTGLFSKLDETLEKLGDVTQAIKQLLAVHETRIDLQEKKSSEMALNLDEEVEGINSTLKIMGEKSDAQFVAINTKLARVDRFIWIGTGILIALNVITKVDLSKVLEFLN